MNLNYLSFEQELAHLQDRITALQESNEGSSVVIAKEIKQLKKKKLNVTQQIYAQLSIWQTVQVARHPRRPYTLD